MTVVRWGGMKASILRRLRVSPRVAALALSGIATATPAAAQDAYTQHQLGVLEAQQQMDRYRGVIQQNELNALSSQVQTERALQVLRQQREAPILAPAIPSRSPASSPEAVEIPDALLADSNTRVLSILARDGR